MCQTINVSPLGKLSDPDHAVLLAEVHLPTAPTANLMIQRAMARIEDYHGEGGVICYAAGIRWKDGRRGRAPLQQIDFERMERSGEAAVYDVDGLQIYLLRDFKDEASKKPRFLSVPLSPLGDCWRGNSRRTINRMYEKIETPSTRAADRRLWSTMFWLDVSRRIMGVQTV